MGASQMSDAPPDDVSPDIRAAISQLRLDHDLREVSTRASNGLALLSAIAALRGGALRERAYLGVARGHRMECAQGHAFEALPNVLFRGGWCRQCAVDERRLGLEAAQLLASERGGRCMSKTYDNNRSKLSWRCGQGHRWLASMDNVSAGSWCPSCAGHLPPHEMFERLLAYARAQGGQVLSPAYVNAKTSMQFRCTHGHEWWARAAHAVRGSWCPACAHPSPAHQLQRLRDIARQQQGALLSQAYVNSSTKVRVRCQLGHEWGALPGNLFRGHWCAACVKQGSRTYDHKKHAARRMLNL